MAKKGKVQAVKSMAELLKKVKYPLRGLKKGEFLTGVVAEKKKNTVFIDIGAKTEGIVTGKELDLVRDFSNQLKVGDKVKVQVRVPENEHGQILLSLRQAAREKAWAFFTKKLKSQSPIEVIGREINRGGVVVNAPYGILGFIPGSQIGQKYQHRPENLLQKKISVQVLEVDPEKNRLVLSERMVSEPEIVAREQKIIAKTKIGQKFSAEITRVEPFGLFVRVNLDPKKKIQVEGLVHISEVSWDKVTNLNQLYHRGETVKVALLRRDNNRLQFSIKRLSPDPWLDIEKKYPYETAIKGTVTKVTNFGVLVRFEPGIEGLIHISKIPQGMTFKEGEKINCYVEKIDKEHRRLSLEIEQTKKPLLYK